MDRRKAERARTRTERKHDQLVRQRYATVCEGIFKMRKSREGICSLLAPAKVWGAMENS